MMTKYILLLPLEYNDGSAIPQESLEKVFEELYSLANGYYVAGLGEGAYRMDDGEKRMEPCLQVWVAIDDSRLGIHTLLLEKVRYFARLLQQESIYLEECVSEVLFVRNNGDVCGYQDVGGEA